MYEDYERTSKIGNSNVDTQFMNIENNNVLGLKEGYDYSKLDEETGLIKENTEVNEKTIMIGKTTTSMLEDNYYIDSSVKAKKGQTGVVDKSFITDGEVGQRIAKVRIRAQRIPKIGDKFCSRAGQKGTIGLILPEEDMPTTADGIKPDIIVNPHAMPSRMTIGHLVETLSSKMAALLGGFADCTAFVNKGPRHKIFGDILRNNGYHSSGNEVLYNGMTGEQLETEIYFGPTFYLRLKHMPKDKVNYRARGPRTVLTRQTVGGRANDGGLRIGEMDRDCLVAHGMTNFIKESMMVRGDQYYMAVCNNTGTIAVYNESKNLFLSPHVDGPLKYNGDVLGQQNVVQHTRFGKNFSVIKVPYAFKLLMQELKSMNVQMRIITEDNIDKLTNLYYGDNHVDINSVDKLDKDFSKQEEIQEFNKKNSIIYGPNITIAESNKRLQSYGFDVNFNAISQASPTDDEKKLLESYNDKEYIPKDVILKLGLDRELSEGLYQGAVVRLRDENNNISRKEYRIIGINEAYNEYHLKDNNPNIEGGLKKVTKEMIYYKYAPDLPDKNLKIGDDFTGTITSNIQELQDIEPIKQLEPIQEVSNETKGEIDIDIDNIADLYDSPEAAYAPTSPQAYYKPSSPDDEFYELSPDKRGGGELLDEEEFYDDEEDDEDDVEENNETRTSTVLNNETVQLRYLGNIEEDKNDDDDSENENYDNNQIKKNIN